MQSRASSARPRQPQHTQCLLYAHSLCNNNNKVCGSGLVRRAQSNLCANAGALVPRSHMRAFCVYQGELQTSYCADCTRTRHESSNTHSHVPSSTNPPTHTHTHTQAPAPLTTRLCTQRAQPTSHRRSARAQVRVLHAVRINSPAHTRFCEHCRV